MATVTPLAAGSGCKIGLLGNVFITVFESPGQMKQLELIDQTQEPIVKEKGRLVSLTIIAAPKLSAPSNEFRDASAKLQAKYQDSVICSAIVIQASGLSAVIARTFLAGYQLMVKQAAPTQTFREVKPAVEWLQTLSPQSEGTSAVLQAVEKFAASR